LSKIITIQQNSDCHDKLKSHFPTKTPTRVFLNTCLITNHKPGSAVTASAVFPDLTCYAYCTSRDVAFFNDVTSQCTSAKLQRIHVKCIPFKLEPNNRLYTRTARRTAHVITALLHSGQRGHLRSSAQSCCPTSQNYSA